MGAANVIWPFFSIEHGYIATWLSSYSRVSNNRTCTMACQDGQFDVVELMVNNQFEEIKLLKIRLDETIKLPVNQNLRPF